MGVLGGGRGMGGKCGKQRREVRGMCPLNCQALSPVPLVPSDAAEQATGAVRTDPRPVPARVPRGAGRGIPLQTRKPRRERICGGPGQILLGAATLHQSHHQTEVGGLGGTYSRSTCLVCLPRDPGGLRGDRGHFFSVISGQDSIRTYSTPGCVRARH